MNDSHRVLPVVGPQRVNPSSGIDGGANRLGCSGAVVPTNSESNAMGFSEFQHSISRN